MSQTYINLQGQQVPIDNFLLKKLDNIKKIIDRNYDCMIIIDGKERMGKSTLGLTVGTYLFPNMGIHNIAVDGKDAIEKFKTLPNKSVLMIDEGSLMFSSKDAMVQEQRRMVKILNVIGQKNLTFIVCLPSFFALTKYLAVDRSRFLLHVYTDENLIRGRYTYFGEKKMRKLYDIGRKNFNSYKRPKAEFIGRFADFKPSWYEEYLEIKRKSLMSALEDQENMLPKKYLKWKEQRDCLITEGFKRKAWNTQQAADLTGLTTREVQVINKKEREEGGKYDFLSDNEPKNDIFLKENSENESKSAQIYV